MHERQTKKWLFRFNTRLTGQKMDLFDYIEVFYDQRRRHSTLGQISPAELERRAKVIRLRPRREPVH